MRFKHPIKHFREEFKKFLHVDATPHHIAVGAAIGAFIAMTPTIGVHLLLVVVLCTVLRASRAAGLLTVWIVNPLTTVPVFTFNYYVGVIVLREDLVSGVGERWQEVGHMFPGLSLLFSAPGAWWHELMNWFGVFWQAMEVVLWPLWVGSLIVGAVSAIAAYVIFYYLIVYYRRRLKPKLHHFAEAHLHHHHHDQPPADGPPPE